MRNSLTSPQHTTASLSISQLFWLLIVVALALGYNVVSHIQGGIGDEDVHRFQINWFVQGRFEIFKYVTMLPFYHLLVAGIGKVTGLLSLNGLRFSHLILAAGVIPAMYLTVRRFYPHDAAARTLLLIFIPFVFPLFFLTYTDLPSLMLVLLMVERCWQRSYGLAGLIALLAVLMRQPNIIWVAFCSCMIALETAREMQLRLIPVNFLNRNFLRALLWRNRYMSAVYLAFAVFVVVNGGVAVGDAEQHPISFNLSNLYFFLLVACAVFLPFNIEQLPHIKQLIQRHLWIIGLLIAGFVLYFYTYEHPHIYNRSELAYYGHNWFLHYTCDVLPWRIVSYVPIAWMAMSVVTAGDRSEYGHLIYLLIPFALLSFVPLPLIEQRYYFVALTLFLLWRPPMSRISTFYNLVIFIALSGYLLFNISRKIFFL